MPLSPQRRLLQIVLAVLVQVSLLPGAVGLGCLSQRLAGDHCCCIEISDLVHESVPAAAEDSCCGETDVTPRSSAPHDDAPEFFVTAESDSSCACEVSPSDPLPAPVAATDNSNSRAHALPAPIGTKNTCYQDQEPRRYTSGAGQARFGPPIHLLNQIFLI